MGGLSPQATRLDQIRDQKHLVRAWIQTRSEAEEAAKPGSELADLLEDGHDEKFAALTRWMLLLFEVSPGVQSISLDGFVLRPDGVSIACEEMRSPWSLNWAKLPLDPEDQIHPDHQNVESVSFACD